MCTSKWHKAVRYFMYWELIINILKLNLHFTALKPCFVDYDADLEG